MKTTFLKAYAVLKSNVNNSFTPYSKLIMTEWIKDSNGEYIQLHGEWCKSSFATIKSNYFILEEIDNQSINELNLKEILNRICTDFFNSLGVYSIEYIEFFAGNNRIGYEYPIISYTEDSKLKQSELETAFNYNAILRYALSCEYAYGHDIPGNSSNEKTLAFNALLGSKFKPFKFLNKMQDGFYGYASLVPSNNELNLEEEIVVSFKGTDVDHGRDFYEDLLLSVQNFAECNVNWQEDGYNFVEEAINYALENGIVDSEGKPKVVLTGHSLGGYAAAQTALRLNLKSRVFSSPSPKIVSAYLNMFSNTMFKSQTINFVREKDPVVSLSGRHEENMLYFPASSNINPYCNHSISNFVEEILLPNYLKSHTFINPSYSYFYPTAVENCGLNHSLNTWGAVQ